MDAFGKLVFCEVIQSVIFFLISPFERRQKFVIDSDNSVFFFEGFCDTSYFFSVFVCSKITGITKASQQQREVGAGKSGTKSGSNCHFCCWGF